MPFDTVFAVCRMAHPWLNSWKNRAVREIKDVRPA
jgi:hypothetical protein